MKLHALFFFRDDKDYELMVDTNPQALAEHLNEYLEMNEQPGLPDATLSDLALHTGEQMGEIIVHTEVDLP